MFGWCSLPRKHNDVGQVVFFVVKGFSLEEELLGHCCKCSRHADSNQAGDILLFSRHQCIIADKNHD